ncbi:PorV/PorQ family protein [bacterium]|nr:PorV/PorQ family protein [FCB group bacterium]MBL7191882.1 PorV/PorQ family protein [bacterium]
MKNISVRLLLVSTLTVFSLSAVSSGQGTTGFEHLRREVSARGSAMAGAFIAVDSGLDALYYNPAGLTAVEGYSGEATYTNDLLDFESGFAAYSQSAGKIGWFGLGVSYMNYGDFDETTSTGYPTGEKFHASDLLFTLGYARKINSFISAGINCKYIHSYIYKVSSSAAACDLGLLIHTPFDSLNIAAGIFNLGGALDAFYQYKDDLPLAYKIGLAKPLEHLPLLISVQAEKYTDSQIYFSGGGEFTISDILKLRFGWSNRGVEQKVDTDKDILAGASLGLGITADNIRIDYSITSHGELGAVSRFTVSGSFN